MSGLYQARAQEKTLYLWPDCLRLGKAASVYYEPRSIGWENACPGRRVQNK